MKTKICLAILFAFLFTLNSSAAEYRIIEVNGSVKVPLRVSTKRGVKTVTLTANRSISPSDVGKIFIADDTNPNGAIGLADCSSSLIFAKAITGSDVQLANRSCATQQQCSSPDCRPDNIRTIAVQGGRRREEMDAFLNNGGQLDISFVAELKNTFEMNTVKFNTGVQNQIDINKQVSPAVIQRQNIPINNKAVIKQRQ